MGMNESPQNYKTGYVVDLWDYLRWDFAPKYSKLIYIRLYNTPDRTKNTIPSILGFPRYLFNAQPLNLKKH